MATVKQSYVAGHAGGGNALLAPQRAGLGRADVPEAPAKNGLRIAGSRLTAEQRAEAVDGQESTYWYLHGFRTGRRDEAHQPPPVWQFRNLRAWRRGRMHGARYGAVLIVPVGFRKRIYQALIGLAEGMPRVRQGSW